MPDEKENLERGRFEGEVMARLASIDKKLDGVAQLEARVRALEQWRYLIVGAGAVAGALADWLVRLLMKN